MEDDQTLATVRERVEKSKKTEWIVSSSVDYTVSVLPLKRTGSGWGEGRAVAHAVDVVSVVFLLFVLLMVLYGVYMVRKWCVCWGMR